MGGDIKPVRETGTSIGVADLPRKGGSMLIRGLNKVLLRPDRPAGQRYAVASMAALLGFVLNWAFWPWLLPYSFTLPMIMTLFALVYGGLGPCCITLVSTLVTTDLFLNNPHSALSSLPFRALIVLAHMVLANVMRSEWLKAEHAKKQVEAALRARDQFMSIAAHELLTPVTSMKLQVQRILRHSEGYDPMLLRRLDVFTNQMDRLVNLSENLLDVTRLVSGKMKFDSKDEDLSLVTAEVVGRHEHLFRAAESDVRMDLMPAITGSWDRLRLEQVILNLISNACKYGDRKLILIRTRVDDGTAFLEVEDQGIGISIEDQRQIFEQFGRAVSEQHFSGMGLGLWIVSRIVQAMEGRISVKSAIGKGSTFTVEMPRYPKTKVNPVEPVVKKAS